MVKLQIIASCKDAQSLGEKHARSLGKLGRGAARQVHGKATIQKVGWKISKPQNCELEVEWEALTG